jgi:hypothetical protein
MTVDAAAAGPALTLQARAQGAPRLKCCRIRAHHRSAAQGAAPLTHFGPRRSRLAQLRCANALSDARRCLQGLQCVSGQARGPRRRDRWTCCAAWRYEFVNDTIIDYYYNACSSGTPSGGIRRHGRKCCTSSTLLLQSSPGKHTGHGASDCLRGKVSALHPDVPCLLVCAWPTRRYAVRTPCAPCTGVVRALTCARPVLTRVCPCSTSLGVEMFAGRCSTTNGLVTKRVDIFSDGLPLCAHPRRHPLSRRRLSLVRAYCCLARAVCLFCCLTVSTGVTQGCVLPAAGGNAPSEDAHAYKD